MRCRGRAVEGSGLENRRGGIRRGFESHRHRFCSLGSMAERLICNQQVAGSTPVGSFFRSVAEWQTHQI